jgi:O-antigen/teichoic acid export membrane protein
MQKTNTKTRILIYIFTSVSDIAISVILIPTKGYWTISIGYMASTVLGTGLFMNKYYRFHIGLDMKLFWRKVGLIYS